MPVGIEAWITQVPPVTRGWLALSVLMSLAVVCAYWLSWRPPIFSAQQCQLVTPLQLYFSWKSTFVNAQVCSWDLWSTSELNPIQPWRAITTFFYFGSISLDFVFHLFFLWALTLYSEKGVLLREETACGIAECWRNRRSQTKKQITSGSFFYLQWCCSYVVVLPLPAACFASFYLKALSPLVNLPFLSSSLAFVPIYLWSRRHPTTPISLFGLITISAPYLPIALVAFSWVLNGTWKAAVADLAGCAVGHVGWFLRDVWTREMVGGPTFFSEAPEVL